MNHLWLAHLHPGTPGTLQVEENKKQLGPGHAVDGISGDLRRPLCGLLLPSGNEEQFAIEHGHL